MKIFADLSIHHSICRDVCCTCTYVIIAVSVKTPHYRHNYGFRSKFEKSERASQEEQNGTNFSSVAPSSEEL